MRNLLLISALLLLAACLAACSIMKTGAIENKVKAALAKDSRTSGSTFEVSCDEQGVVTITGDVETPEASDAVTEIAAAVPGVTRVLNRCRVPEPGSTLMQDFTVDSPAF